MEKTTCLFNANGLSPSIPVGKLWVSSLTSKGNGSFLIMRRHFANSSPHLCSPVTNSCHCSPEYYGPTCTSKYNDCERGSRELCVHGICEDLIRQTANEVGHCTREVLFGWGELSKGSQRPWRPHQQFLVNQTSSSTQGPEDAMLPRPWDSGRTWVTLVLRRPQNCILRTLGYPLVLETKCRWTESLTYP